MINLKKKLILMITVSVFMISVVLATTYAADVAFEKNILEYKEKKVASFKIKWDANGGKIGSKKTVTSTVKKGAKVKLVTSPKKTGYKFKGWYTAKTGGTKITKNTKPTKSLTYYAQWEKSRVLTAEEKKLIGTWSSFSTSGSTYDSGSGAYLYSTGNGRWYTFCADGTFDQTIIITGMSPIMQVAEGTWSGSGGTIYMIFKRYQKSYDHGKTFTPWASHWDPNQSMKIIHGTENGRKYIKDVSSDTVFYNR